MEYWGDQTRLTGETIARAARHFDTTEIKRVNSYNLELLVFLIRRYIHRLATNPDEGTLGDEGGKMYRYVEPVLIEQGLETSSTAWNHYHALSEAQRIITDLVI